MKLPLTLLTICVGALLFGFGQSAYAYKLGDLACKQPLCGKLSNVPRTSLVSVNPDPLATVDAGDSQNVTVRWSLRFGLRATHEFCATATLTSGPSSTDPCTSLPGMTVVYKGQSGTTLEDSLTLSANFYRPTAEFYIRTTSLIHLIGAPPPTADSNRRAFTWPLNLPNLYSHNPDISIESWGVMLEHDITNQGSVDADASVTDLVVNVCDGLAMLPLLDPEDPQSERVCAEGSESFMTSFTIQQSVDPIAAGVRELTVTDITGMLPFSGNGLWVSMTAYADSQQDVAESNEQDNVRFDTIYVLP